MEVLAIWLLTIIMSVGMNIGNIILLLKNVYDAGYKLDLNKIKDFNRQVNPDFQKQNMIVLFIPFVNIIHGLKVMQQYNQVCEDLLDRLDVVGVLKELTKEEHDLYQQNPTGWHAFKMCVSAGSQQRQQEGQSTNQIIYVENGKQNTIYFYKGKNMIKIVKVEGSITSLSIAEQCEKLNECLVMLLCSAQSSEDIYAYLSGEKILYFEEKGIGSEGVSCQQQIEELRMEKEKLTGSIDEIPHQLYKHKK